MNAKEYIKYLLSVEEYSFSLEEIANKTDGNNTSLKFELVRLTKKGEIINLRKGFYIIIPPRFSISKKLPIQLYCEKLFHNLAKNFYLLLFFFFKIKFISFINKKVIMETRIIK